jgi:hypothetical protein
LTDARRTGRRPLRLGGGYEQVVKITAKAADGRTWTVSVTVTPYGQATVAELDRESTRRAIYLEPGVLRPPRGSRGDHTTPGRVAGLGGEEV